MPRRCNFDFNWNESQWIAWIHRIDDVVGSRNLIACILCVYAFFGRIPLHRSWIEVAALITGCVRFGTFDLELRKGRCRNALRIDGNWYDFCRSSKTSSSGIRCWKWLESSFSWNMHSSLFTNDRIIIGYVRFSESREISSRKIHIDIVRSIFTLSKYSAELNARECILRIWLESGVDSPNSANVLYTSTICTQIFGSHSTQWAHCPGLASKPSRARARNGASKRQFSHDAIQLAKHIEKNTSTTIEININKSGAVCNAKHPTNTQNQRGKQTAGAME